MNPMRSAFVTFALALAFAGIAEADTNANLANGFAADKAFELGDVDSINGFNGNLVLSIPIGQTYPVGTGLAYRLTLVYNGNPWLFVSGTNQDGSEYTGASPNPLSSNAGLGWRLSLGHLRSDPEISRLVYTAGDGSDHVFYDTLHENETANPSIQYTRDGSYLRLVNVGGGGYRVEMPNGQAHVFAGLETDVKQINDRFGNFMQADYSDPYNWRITDSQGRVQTVAFDVAEAALGKRVRQVVLQAFAGSTVTYNFEYTHPTVAYPCPANAPGPQSDTLSLLSSVHVDLPGGAQYRYSMPSYQTSRTAADCKAPGAIDSLVLPAGAAIAWTYQNYVFPAETKRPWRSSSNGVQTRTVSNASGAPQGTWTYATALENAIPPAKPQELMNTVTDPLGFRTERYFSVSFAAATSGWSIFEYGLPLTHRIADATGARFLSTREYDAGNHLVLSTYARYEVDSRVNFLDSADASRVNQRLASTRTAYEDDGGRYVDVESTGFDGIGHYAQTTTTDNFKIVTSPVVERTTRTGWQPRPDDNHNWVLNTYTFQEQREGKAIDRQELSFETDTGFLSCVRLLANRDRLGSTDLLTVYGRDSLGDVVLETRYGGDAQPLRATEGCSSPPATPSYSTSYEYSFGVRRKATVRVTVAGAPVDLNLLDLDVDANTGLASASRDAKQLRTDLTYDALGRLTMSDPPGDDPATTFTYHQAPDVPSIEAVSPLGHQKSIYDGLGRVARHEVGLPGATGRVGVTLTAYDALGHRTSVTAPGGSNATTFTKFDAFGRPGTITTPDGKVILLDYQGTRISKRTVGVWNGTVEALGTTKEEYDGLGRLRSLTEPNGTLTRYTYEVGGKLAVEAGNAGVGNSQFRSFIYDGRGFLMSEVQPESGKTDYEYDAMGNMTAKTTPSGSIFPQYDEAGRLIQASARRGAPPQDALRTISYAADGKLIFAGAMNDRKLGGVCTRFEVRQDFAYDPSHGRLQSQSTGLRQQDPATQQWTQLEQWSQSYLYDGAGRMTQVTYPCGVPGVPCGGLRTLTTNYEMGRPVSVSGFANAITYNDEGTVATIQHANQVIFTQTPDPNGAARPQSLQAALGASQLWPAESYSYDASGNIKSIGGKSYSYDPVLRLTSASKPGGYRQYDYDVFGNLIRVGSGADPSTATYVNYSIDTAANNNHLIGAGYDGSGALTSFQGRNYTWDLFRNLASLDNGSGGEAWAHVYDAAGERVWSWRSAPSRLDTYALRGPDGKVLSDFTKQGTTYTVEDYVYREGQLLGANLNGQAVHFDVDHLGSVRLETLASGAVKSYREYWPFGEVSPPPTTASPDSEEMKFTGQERDLGDPTNAADDLDYMHARYYSPLFGRFLSTDPLRGADLATSSWNRYAYCRNNPLGRVDPLGLSYEPAVGIGGDVFTFIYSAADGHFIRSTSNLDLHEDERFFAAGGLGGWGTPGYSDAIFSRAGRLAERPVQYAAGYAAVASALPLLAAGGSTLAVVTSRGSTMVIGMAQTGLLNVPSMLFNTLLNTTVVAEATNLAYAGAEGTQMIGMALDGTIDEVAYMGGAGSTTLPDLLIELDKAPLAFERLTADVLQYLGKVTYTGANPFW